MSDDDTFVGGVAGHVRRIAERREADRRRMEEQARKDALVIENKAAEFAEQVRRELLERRSVAVPDTETYTGIRTGIDTGPQRYVDGRICRMPPVQGF